MIWPLAKIADDLNQSKNKVYKLLAGLKKCVLHMSYWLLARCLTECTTWSHAFLQMTLFSYLFSLCFHLWRSRTFLFQIPSLLEKFTICTSLASHATPSSQTTYYNNNKREMFFSSCHERGTKKKFWVLMTSDLRVPRSDALPLSHGDSTIC